jgi:hypothetical protein
MEKDMRVFVLAAMLLASSSLWSSAEEPGKAPAAAPQAGTPAQTDQNSQPQQDQRIGRDQPKTEDREMGPDSKTRRGDGDRTGRDDREMGRGGMMRHSDGDRMGRDDHEMGQDWRRHRGDDVSRDREPERGDRDWDRADRDRDNRGYVDADRPRRRVKVCVEYDNGDEYCRYRQ